MRILDGLSDILKFFSDSIGVVKGDFVQDIPLLSLSNQK
jgi:hypothetical protein